MITKAERFGRHEEYYAQFVDNEVKEMVLRVIGKDRIVKSTDKEAMNDIPLRRWDSIFFPTYPTSMGDMYRATGDFPTTANLVCIAKEAARQIREEN